MDNALREKNRLYQKKYRAAHVEALKTWRDSYYQLHGAEIKAKKVALRKLHPEKNKQTCAKYYAAHREQVLANISAYSKTHRDRVHDQEVVKRLRKRIATVEQVSRAEVYERDKGRCHICHKHVPKRKWHLDHLLPLAHGGEHSYRNVAVSCPRCNMSKGTGKLPSQLRLCG